MREISRTPKRGLGGLGAGGRGGVGRVEATNTTCRGRGGLDSTSGSELSLTIASLRKKGGRCAPRRVVDQLRGLAAIRCFVWLASASSLSAGKSWDVRSRRVPQVGKDRKGSGAGPGSEARYFLDTLDAYHRGHIHLISAASKTHMIYNGLMGKTFQAGILLRLFRPIVSDIFGGLRHQKPSPLASWHRAERSGWPHECSPINYSKRNGFKVSISPVSHWLAFRD